MLSSLVNRLQLLLFLPRIFDLESVMTRQCLVLSLCASRFEPMRMDLVLDFDLVGDAVDELLFPLAHDLSFVFDIALNIQLLIKLIHAELEVVELEEELLQVELTLQ